MTSLADAVDSAAESLRRFLAVYLSELTSEQLGDLRWPVATDTE